LSNIKINKIAYRIVFYWVILLLILGSVMVNSKDSYPLSKWWLGNEQAMETTIKSIEQVNAQIRNGDKVLVVGLESTVETIYRSVCYLEKQIESDATFSVVSGEPAFTGKFGRISQYISENEIEKDKYDVIIDYSNNNVKIKRLNE